MFFTGFWDGIMGGKRMAFSGCLLRKQTPHVGTCIHFKEGILTS